MGEAHPGSVGGDDGAVAVEDGDVGGQRVDDGLGEMLVEADRCLEIGGGRESEPPTSEGWKRNSISFDPRRYCAVTTMALQVRPPLRR